MVCALRLAEGTFCRMVKCWREFFCFPGKVKFNDCSMAARLKINVISNRCDK